MGTYRRNHATSRDSFPAAQARNVATLGWAENVHNSRLRCQPTPRGTGWPQKPPPRPPGTFEALLVQHDGVVLGGLRQAEELAPGGETSAAEPGKEAGAGGRGGCWSGAGHRRRRRRRSWGEGGDEGRYRQRWGRKSSLSSGWV